MGRVGIFGGVYGNGIFVFRNVVVKIAILFI